MRVGVQVKNWPATKRCMYMYVWMIYAYNMLSIRTPVFSQRNEMQVLSPHPSPNNTFVREKQAPDYPCHSSAYKAPIGLHLTSIGSIFESATLAAEG